MLYYEAVYSHCFVKVERVQPPPSVKIRERDSVLDFV